MAEPDPIGVVPSAASCARAAAPTSWPPWEMRACQRNRRKFLSMFPGVSGRHQSVWVNRAASSWSGHRDASVAGCGSAVQAGGLSARGDQPWRPGRGQEQPAYLGPRGSGTAPATCWESVLSVWACRLRARAKAVSAGSARCAATPAAASSSLSRLGARFQRCRWPVSPGRSPSETPVPWRGGRTLRFGSRHAEHQAAGNLNSII